MNKLFYLFTFLFFSCTAIYTGSYNQPNLNKIQPEELGAVVSKWEDGLRTKGNSNEFEWWYFDAKLDDGTIFVCYFYKVHFLNDKYFIGLNYNDDIGNNFFKLKYFDKNDVEFSNDSCMVRMGNNYIKGNLSEYQINLDPNDFEGFGGRLSLKSHLKPYRPKDGVIKAGDDFFAWLAAVPHGSTKGRIILNGASREVSGDGYHDHNWGNTPLQKLFDGWTWFRGQVGENTIIAAELNLTKQRGGYDIPILYIANKEKVLTNQFGDDGVFTKYSDLIGNLYSKKNEPLFLNFSLLTSDGISISIKGKELIDNSELFKRMGLPIPIRWVLNNSGIDPYYSRYKSSIALSGNGIEIGKGFGILEIMDLK
ncbi:MAG: hypothetical protein ACKVHA_09040 [Fidelibacterota bacterium]